jgi:hypothetical protein
LDSAHTRALQPALLSLAARQGVFRVDLNKRIEFPES